MYTMLILFYTIVVNGWSEAAIHGYFRDARLSDCKAELEAGQATRLPRNGRASLRNHSADIAAEIKPMGIAAFDIGAFHLCQLEAFQSAQRTHESYGQRSDAGQREPLRQCGSDLRTETD